MIITFLEIFSTSTLSRMLYLYNISNRVAQIVSVSQQEMSVPSHGNTCSHTAQVSKYIKIGTSPASQKLLAIYGEKINFTRNIKIFIALQPEALVNTSRGVLFFEPCFFSYL